MLRTMRPIALSTSQHRRLARVAREAGRTAGQMLKFVLRDGFEYCEWQVRQSLAADTEATRHGITSHDVVMREARELIESVRGPHRDQAVRTLSRRTFRGTRGEKIANPKLVACVHSGRASARTRSRM
jgi:hypothetical protein